MTTSLRKNNLQKTSLNNMHCKVRTNIKRSLNNSPFTVQNVKSTFLRPSCSVQATVAHSFLTLRLDPPKGGSIYVFSANPSSPTQKYGTFAPALPERGISLDNPSIIVWIDVHRAHGRPQLLDGSQVADSAWPPDTVSCK